MREEAKYLARELRKRQTPAESAFWELVRNRRFENRKFYRQFPFVFEYENQQRFFIADFYCREKKIIFEIDGGIHTLQKEYDRAREELLQLMNVKVVRFTNDEVLRKTPHFLKKLKEVLT